MGVRPDLSTFVSCFAVWQLVILFIEQRQNDIRSSEGYVVERDVSFIINKE